MCTRGSRGLAPGELWPMPEEQPSAKAHGSFFLYEKRKERGMLCCSPGHGPLFNIVVCQCSSIAGCNHIVQLLLDVDLILYSARNSSEILLLSVISLWWYSLRASCSTRSLADTGIMWGRLISENNWEWTDKPLVHIDSVLQDFCFVSLMAPYCCSRESGLCLWCYKNKELTEKAIVRCDWLIIQSVTVAEKKGLVTGWIGKIWWISKTLWMYLSLSKV